MKTLIKKMVLLTFIIPFIGGETYAQKGFQVGFELNPQLSYLYNQDDLDSKYYTQGHAVSGHFGFSGQYGFTENFGVGLNVLYAVQGDKYEWKDATRIKSLSYFKIPVMFTVNIPTQSAWRFVGKIGPQVSFLTDARLYDGEMSVLVKNYTNAFVNYDVGGVVSLGTAYQLSDRFSIDAALRYDMGFVDVEKDSFRRNVHNPDDLVTPSPASSPRGATYNMTYGINVGIRYNFM